MPDIGDTSDGVAPTRAPERSSERQAGVKVRAAATALVLSILIALLYLVPRLVDINRMVVVDEALWLGRSANFAYGLVHFHPMETYQFAHPGVTTMWAGAIAMFVMENVFVRHHDMPINSVVNVHEALRNYGIDPLDMLVYARVTKLLGQALLFVIAFWLIVRIFGRWVAIVAAVMIACDPFLIGHDRLLHIDGLLSITSFTTLLAFIYARQRRANVWPWVLCGVLFTLTCLSRSVGGILLPIFAAIVILPPAIAAIRRRLDIEAAWSQIKTPVLGFIVPAVISAWILWPALIWAPGIVVTDMLSFSITAVDEGHELPTYFNGKSVGGDPGWIFYPETMLWRMTPFTLAGVAILVVALLLRRERIVPRSYRGPIAILGAFAAIFTFGMTLADKKFDRYVLPVYPIAELFAAIAVVGVARLCWERRSTIPNIVAAIAILLAVGGQAQAAYSDRTYGLDYYNPLLGGMKGADDSMLIGWGEGLDQAADYIEAQPDGAYAIVRTSANRVSLLYFVPETTDVEAGGLTASATGIANWAETDYYVSYTLQWQRNLTQMVLHQLAGYQPVHVVSIDGVEMARVYKLEDIPPPQKMVDSLNCTWDFGEQVRLLTFTDIPNPVPQAAQSTTNQIINIIKSITGANASETPTPTATTPVTTPAPTATPPPTPTTPASPSPVAPASASATPGTPAPATPAPSPTPTAKIVVTPTPAPTSESNGAAAGPPLLPGRVVAPTSGPNESRLVTLIFATGASYAGTGSFDVKVTLVPKAGIQSPIVETTTLTPSTVPGALREATVNLTIPANRDLNSYWMEVTVSDPATGKVLPGELLDAKGNPVPKSSTIVNLCSPTQPKG
ncbi:MAG TPA: glycosyltransferase family 39 protein [Thermomicrobiales bacterium]|nr:glycosyltransferase family 39 protein [Thermomicrobiales bacterium]